MTTEPTQTPSVPMPLADIKPTSADEAIHRLHDSERRRMRDRDEATQRIAKLEAQLRAQASELTEAVRLARKFDVETVHLQERVKQLEGALEDCERELRFAPPPRRRAHLWEAAIAKSQQALSPSPPAVEVERWAKEKAAYKAGKRIQQRIRIALQDWTPWTYCPYPTWGPDLGDVEYRIHPDDDTPPVQTEEKAEERCKHGVQITKPCFDCDDHPIPLQTEEKPATVAEEGTSQYPPSYEVLAKRHDALVERSVGAMDIAEGTEGHLDIPRDCPMLVAVSNLRRDYDLLLSQQPKRPTIDELLNEPATVPLTVAEKLADALERQCPVSDSLLRLKDSALAQFNALTK